MATSRLPGFLVPFVLKPWQLFVREHGNSERILDVSLVVKLLPTLKHVINVNRQKKFHRTTNEIERYAQASYLVVCFFGIGSMLIICIQPQS